MTLDWIVFAWLFHCALAGIIRLKAIRHEWSALAMIATVALVGCTRPLPGPVRPYASTDGGCQVLDRITTDRMIATPDGTALVIHCDAGAP